MNMNFLKRIYRLASDRMIAELDTLIDTIRPVMQYQLDRFRALDGGRTDWDLWYSYIEIIRDFAVNRKAPAKAQFMAWAGIDEAKYGYLHGKALRTWGTTVGK